jgi:fatty-acyl-CoA synthase
VPSVNHQPLTPLTFLQRSARVFSDRVAVIDNDQRLTYREFSAHVAALAGGLAASDIRPGDRVAFLAPNGLALLAAHFAVPQLGAVLVPINIRLARPEVLHILGHSGARALVVDPALFAAPGSLKAELPELRIVVTLGSAEDADCQYDQLIELGLRSPAVTHAIDENDLISLNYTSGTTGLPKGVMYTHRGAYLNALGNAVEIHLPSETRYLWTLPMFHCNGWCYAWAVTAVGGTHVCLPKVVPPEVFRLVEREAITHLCAAPTVLIDLAQYAESMQLKLSHPLTVITGGAAPAPQMIRHMEQLGATVVHAYGLTETYGPSTICQWRSEWNQLPFNEKAALKARQGVADLMVEQRVVREDMTDVAEDGRELGEVVLRGNAVMQGYYQDEAATEQVFRGGWFHTGDLAVMHENGYIEIQDRAKDIIISGGENVSTLEVERVIFAHPAVLEAAVVPSPHERWGQVPKAFVVLRPGAVLEAKELSAFCRDRLAGFKVPNSIQFVDRLPKTSTGKIQKYVLRSLEDEGGRKTKSVGRPTSYGH